jgi:hypothetical protein
MMDANEAPDSECEEIAGAGAVLREQKASGFEVGFLLNFGTRKLHIKRLVNYNTKATK